MADVVVCVHRQRLKVHHAVLMHRLASQNNGGLSKRCILCTGWAI